MTGAVTLNTETSDRTEFKRSRRYLIIIGIALVFFIAFNALYYFGVSSPLTNTPLTLANYNSETQDKTWTQLSSAYPWLVPSSSPFVGSYSYKLNVSDADSIFWPKNFLVFRVAITPPTSPYAYYQPPKIGLPSILVMVIDQNGLVRGKLFVQLSSADNYVNSQTSLYLTFAIPSDLQGSQLTVIAELWGIGNYNTGQVVSQIPLNYPNIDPVYGEFPANPQASGNSAFAMLGYDQQRFSTVMPWPESILQIGPVVGVAGFLSASISALTWYSRRLARFLKRAFPEFQAFVLFAVLAFFFLALFMILVALRVA